MLNYFVRRCRANLHLVLAFSPIGDAFRTRLRMFPSLVNCCTIDWFTRWPEEALRSVAESFLKDVSGLEERLKLGVTDMCVNMQERVRGMTEDFRKELGRHYYVTPTSYLELIATFKSLLASTRQEVSGRQRRYGNGLQKLLETADQVWAMPSPPSPFHCILPSRALPLPAALPRPPIACCPPAPSHWLLPPSPSHWLPSIAPAPALCR